jgi:hypothetical protein
VLRVNRAAEMGNIVPDWEADKMPDMHIYAKCVDGVALVVDPAQQMAGRPGRRPVRSCRPAR